MSAMLLSRSSPPFDGKISATMLISLSRRSASSIKPSVSENSLAELGYCVD